MSDVLHTLGCTLPSSVPSSLIQTRTISITVSTMTIAPRPRVYAVEALTSEALALAEKHFDLVKHSDPNFADWRERAEGLLVRNAYITPGDVEVMARHKLRYISKQGVGVDNFDLDSLRKHGIPLMNTPGVNAQAVAELAFGLIMR